MNPNFKNIDAGKSLTKEDLATSCNNYYEFSLDKDEVKQKVEKWNLKSSDWRIEVTGLVEKPKTYIIDDLVKLAGGEEESIYRFRCVEAWSMVLHWGGFELAKLEKALKPTAKAKYVVFQSVNDKEVAPGISELPLYPWPYQEGLTLEEAMNL